MDRRGCCSAGKTSHFNTARGSRGNEIRAVCVATMVSPFGTYASFLSYRTGTFFIALTGSTEEMACASRVGY